MEAIVFNIDKYVKSNIEKSKRQDILKSNDFNSTLKSIKSNLVKETKLSKSVIKNEHLSQKHPLKEINNKEKIDLKTLDKDVDNIKETDNKEDSLVLENIMYLLNNKVTTIDDIITSNTTVLEDNISATNTVELTNRDIFENLIIENFLDNPKNVVSTGAIFEDIMNKQITDEEFSAIMENIESENNKNNKIVHFNINYNEDMNGSMELTTEFLASTSNSEEMLNDNKINISNDEQSFEQDNFGQDAFEHLNQNNKLKTLENNQTLESLEINEASKKYKSQNESIIDLGKNNPKYLENVSIDIESESTVNPKEVIQQIVDKFKIETSQSKNEITLKLKPEILGKMTMSIEVVKDTVIAKLIVENQKVKEIIEGNLIQLRDEIKDSGLEIKTFEVFVGNSSDFNKHNSNQFNLKQSNKKIKIKSQNTKTGNNYEESFLDNKIESIGLYSEKGLNLLA